MIRIQVDEYENLKHELEQLHTDSVQFIQEYLTDINGILAKNEGFHADLISAKIDIILEIFRDKILPKLMNTFECTEEEIQIFAESLAEMDESGGTKVQWEE